MSRSAATSAPMPTSSLMQSRPSRPMTVPAMRAAVLAIRAGVFDGADVADAAAVDDLRTAALRPGLRTVAARMPWAENAVGSPVVVVMPGHAGAGASTVALAAAEGLANSRRVELVEYAGPVRSGLAAASNIELGADGSSWRRGRRGRLDVLRLARSPGDAELPLPPEADDADRLLVVDVGWYLTAALLRTSGASVHGEQVVLVTRVTVPAVRQTEHAMAAIDGETVVAAVGPARWPRPVEANCGPLLTQARSSGRVVRVPVDRRLESTGLTGDQLPRSVAGAGRSLAALLRRALPPQSGRAEESR